MGLESVTYINDLVVTWPLGSDKVRQGDDHLRNIKLAIKNSFPNITGAMTATQATLNSLPANIADALNHLAPVGLIAMWSGNIASPPTGWSVCNGQTVSGFGVVPDLRDRFIIGAGGSHAVAATGGAASVSSAAAGDHSHGGASGGHSLTEAQMPAHTHGVSGGYLVNGNGTTDGVDGGGQANSAIVSAITTDSVGSGEAHSHTIAASGNHQHTVDTLPPFYALAFIIKTSAYVAS